MDDTVNDESSFTSPSLFNNIIVKYINLLRRVDRNEYALTQFENMGIPPTQIHRYDAINGLDIVNDLLVKNHYTDRIIQSLIAKNRSFKKGELGCLLSHYFLLQSISNDDTINDDQLIFIFRFICSSYLNRLLERRIRQALLHC